MLLKFPEARHTQAVLTCADLNCRTEADRKRLFLVIVCKTLEPPLKHCIMGNIQINITLTQGEQCKAIYLLIFIVQRSSITDLVL